MPQDLHSLRKAGVRFLPWVGPRYENGFMKRRLLIVGHSHYEQWLGATHELGEEITNCCIHKAASGSNDSPLWANIERALLNGVRANDVRAAGATIWDHVAFYNFLQSSLRTASSRATARQFEESAAPFFEVLEQLRPERVLVCGIRSLWWRMPPTQAQSRPEIEAYRLQDGCLVWCLAIHHPSRAFSWKKWHPLISSFLQDTTLMAEVTTNVC